MRSVLGPLLSIALACDSGPAHAGEVPSGVQDASAEEPRNETRDDAHDSLEDTSAATDSVASVDAPEEHSCREGRIPVSAVMAQGSQVYDERTWEVTLAGTVTAHAGNMLELTTPQEVYRFTYTIGDEVLPVLVGELLEVTWRTSGTPAFGQMGRLVSSGLAIRDDHGALIAVIDDGKYGAAWPSSHSAFDGLTVTSEDIGCPIDVANCGYHSVGMRFAHVNSTDVVVPPLSSDTLNADGYTYRVVNAYSQLPSIPLTCVDTSANFSWLIVRLD